MMRPLLVSSLLLAGLGSAHAAYTYIDATSGVSGNTTLSDGSTFTPPLNGTTGNDNLWEQRPFGSGGTIFEAGGESITENVHEIRTVISGLTAGADYTIYVHFWDPTSTNEDWNIRAGLSSAPGTNPIYTAADATADVAGSNASILANTLTYTSAPSIFNEGGRDMLAAFLGTATADSNGRIFVYVDDLPAATTVNLRTWYDGVSYQAVPEPGSVALALLASLSMLRRRR